MYVSFEQTLPFLSSFDSAFFLIPFQRVFIFLLFCLPSFDSLQEMSCKTLSLAAIFIKWPDKFDSLRGALCDVTEFKLNSLDGSGSVWVSGNMTWTCCCLTDDVEVMLVSVICYQRHQCLFGSVSVSMSVDTSRTVFLERSVASVFTFGAQHPDTLGACRSYHWDVWVSAWQQYQECVNPGVEKPLACSGVWIKETRSAWPGS